MVPNQCVEVFMSLNKKSKTDKSPGPDGLHPRVLRELSEVIAYPLKIILDKTFADGKLPTKWKTAEVRPIFKKGSKTDPGNYRPVSLTSFVCKVFESLVRDSLFNHFTETTCFLRSSMGFAEVDHAPLNY